MTASIFDNLRRPAANGDPLRDVFSKRDLLQLYAEFDQFRIVPSTLQSVEDMIQWGMSDVGERARQDPKNVELCLDILLLSYVEHNQARHKQGNVLVSLPEMRQGPVLNFLSVALRRKSQRWQRSANSLTTVHPSTKMSLTKLSEPT